MLVTAKSRITVRRYFVVRYSHTIDYCSYLTDSDS